MPRLPLTTTAPLQPVNVLRSFSFIGLIAIVVAIMVLALSFRKILIESVTQQGEANNFAVAQAALHAVQDDLASFLLNAETGASEPLPSSIAAHVYELVEDTVILKVKIYDRRRDVVFSTKLAETGRHQSDNAGVIAALSGRVESKLIYRDSFNSLDGVTEDDNLIQTYLPIRVGRGTQPVGVFEIYTDASSMIAMAIRYETITAFASVLIMAMLYLSLVVIVRRIERLVVVQQDTLKERSSLLAVLSRRMLNGQELEKRRISAELHECVAQTISATKLGLEAAVFSIRTGKDATAMLESMAPPLQTAIQDVRLMAMGLCPPSLNELGLLPTLRWRCAKVVEANPEIKIDIELNVSEDVIQENLRAIIYRVVDDVFSELSANEAIYRMMLSLECDSSKVTLTIGDDMRRGGLPLDEASKSYYRSARERIILSGGKYTLQHNVWGGITINSLWLI